MATSNRAENAPVIDQLFDDARLFDFFQAVRVLYRHAQQADSRDASQAGQPVGYDNAPADEVLRFHAHQTLGFPTSDVERIDPSGSRPDDVSATGGVPKTPPEMQVNFLGLTGPHGVLPGHYTRLVLQQLREGNAALAQFFDLFNHRLISLFYRAWEKHQAAVLVEQNRSTSTAQEPDLFTFALLSLLGLGTDGQRGRMAIVDDVFLYYSGCFSQRPANAVSLERMLAELLDAQVRVQQLHGQWLWLEPEDGTRLSYRNKRSADSAGLGRGTVLGRRVWDWSSKFRIVIGPVGYELFERLMPCGDTLLPLCHFVRTYVGPDLDFDVQPLLRAAEIPRSRLDRTSRLGWNTWVRCNALSKDADDAVFRARSPV